MSHRLPPARRRHVRMGIALLVPTLWACADAPGDPNALNVQAVDGPLAAAPRLSLELHPLQRFGGLRDDPDRELNARNGMLEGLLTRNGGLVAIDGHRLFRFEPDGSLRSVNGVLGSGPGESRLLSAVCLVRGDSVLTFDVALRRASVTGPDGGPARQFSAPARGIMPKGGCLTDGSFLVAIVGSDPAAPGAGHLRRLSLEGDSLGDSEAFPLMSPVASTSIAVAGTRYWIANPQSRDIGRYTATGELDLSLRLAEELMPMDAQEAEASQVVVPAQGSPAKRTSPLGTGQPAPLFQRALADGPERLWLQLATGDWRLPERWVAVSASGTLTGQLELPPSEGYAPRRALQFQGDRVLVLDRDAEGVAWFEVYRIIGLRP